MAENEAVHLNGKEEVDSLLQYCKSMNTTISMIHLSQLKEVESYIADLEKENAELKGLKLTDEQYEFLKDLSHKLKTQDNCMTANPIYVVYSKREICVDSDRTFGVEDDHVECYLPGDPETHMPESALPEWIKEHPDYSEDDFERVTVGDVNQFETACFTRTGAEEYLKRNGHNLRKPYIYVESLFRNYEMQKIVEIIGSMLDNQKDHAEKVK